MIFYWLLGWARDGNVRGQVRVLTNGNTTMRATEVDVGLRDGAHADLIVSAGQEAGECTDKRHSAMAGGAADTYTNQILLSDKTLHKPIWVRILWTINIRGFDSPSRLNLSDFFSYFQNSPSLACF